MKTVPNNITNWVLIIQSILLFRYEQDTYYLNSEIFINCFIIILNLFIISNFYFLFVIIFLLQLSNKIKFDFDKKN